MSVTEQTGIQYQVMVPDPVTSRTNKARKTHPIDITEQNSSMIYKKMYEKFKTDTPDFSS